MIGNPYYKSNRIEDALSRVKKRYPVLDQQQPITPIDPNAPDIGDINQYSSVDPKQGSNQGDTGQMTTISNQPVNLQQRIETAPTAIPIPQGNTGTDIVQDDTTTGGAYAGLAGALGGGLLSMLNNGGNEKKYWEGRTAQAQNTANRELNLATDPEANRRASQLALETAKSGAVQQASNIGATAATAGGLGGDVSSAQLQGIKAAAPVMQTSGQYDTAIAGLQGQKAQEESGKLQQLMAGTQQRFAIDDSANYVQKPSKYSGLLSMIQAGANTGNILNEIGSQKNKKLEKK